MRGKGSKRNWSGRGDSHLSEKNKKNKGEDKSSKEGVIEVKIEEGGEEKSDLIKFGNESLLKAMLPTLDNLARAVDHGRSAKENSSLLEGVEITQKQFFSILEKLGVKPIKALGAIFDPEKHEAISKQERDQEPSRVIAEVEKGYFFHDRLLRPAKVIVSKAK